MHVLHDDEWDAGVLLDGDVTVEFAVRTSLSKDRPTGRFFFREP